MNSRTYRITIFVCILVVVFGAIYAVSQIKPGKSGKATPTPTPGTFASMTDGEFTMTAQGPIVANELYHSSTITISASNRTFTAYNTYDNVVAANNTFSNNAEAYGQFADAMQNAGYNLVTKSTQKEVGSTCPTGIRYTYTFTSGGQTTTNSWSTTCGGKTETMGGQIGEIQNLTRSQIPNISQVPGYSQFPF